MAPAPVSRNQAHAPRWLTILVIVMGVMIVVGFVIVAAEIARRISNPNAAGAPAAAAGTAWTGTIALPPGGRVVAMQPLGDRFLVHVEGGAAPQALLVDARTGTLLGTVSFPPGPPRAP